MRATALRSALRRCTWDRSQGTAPAGISLWGPQSSSDSNDTCSTPSTSGRCANEQSPAAFSSSGMITRWFHSSAAQFARARTKTKLVEIISFVPPAHNPVTLKPVPQRTVAWYCEQISAAPDVLALHNIVCGQKLHPSAVTAALAVRLVELRDSPCTTPKLAGHPEALLMRLWSRATLHMDALLHEFTPAEVAACAWALGGLLAAPPTEQLSGSTASVVPSAPALLARCMDILCHDGGAELRAAGGAAAAKAAEGAALGGYENAAHWKALSQVLMQAHGKKELDAVSSKQAASALGAIAAKHGDWKEVQQTASKLGASIPKPAAAAAPADAK